MKRDLQTKSASALTPLPQVMENHENQQTQNAAEYVASDEELRKWVKHTVDPILKNCHLPKNANDGAVLPTDEQVEFLANEIERCGVPIQNIGKITFEEGFLAFIIKAEKIGRGFQYYRKEAVAFIRKAGNNKLLFPA